MPCPGMTSDKQAPCSACSVSGRHNNAAVDSHVFSALLRSAQEPLTAILGFADLALDAASPMDEVRACLESIRGNGQRLYDLLAGAMAIAELDESEAPPDLTPWSPTELCRDAVAEIRAQSEPNPVSVTLECDPGVAETILTDPLRLRQLVLVLLKRTLCCAPKAGVRVTISPRPGCACGNGQSTMISVSAEPGFCVRPDRDIIGDNLADALAESLGARLVRRSDGASCEISLCLCDDGCEVQRVGEDDQWLMQGGKKEAA